MSGKAKGLMAAVALMVLAGGCTSIRDHRGYLQDPALVDSVMVGIDNRNSVEHTLGRPTFITQYGQESWYYVSTDTKQAAFRRPHTTAQMILRIRFDDRGNVATIDRRGAEQVVRLNPDGKYTPTLGKKRSFFEDLFGNIGTVGAGGGQGGGQGSNTGGGQ